MQYPKSYLLLTLILLLSLRFSVAWAQCTPPPQLASTPCASCSKIKLFYCEGETNPLSLSAQLQQNANYQAGATFIWYEDLNGTQGTLLTNEPLAEVSLAGSDFYWVSQTLGGCEGPAIQLQVRTRRTPRLVADSIADFCYPAFIDISGQASDQRNAGDLFAFYRSEPTAGVMPFQVLTATNGQFNPANQSIFESPAQPTPYWVICINTHSSGHECADTTSFTANPIPIPQLDSLADITACGGDSIFLPEIMNINPQASTSLIFWQNDNPNIGLDAFGYGAPPAFRTPKGLKQADTAVISFFLLSGPCVALDTAQIIIRPKPQLQKGLADTICSRVGAQLSLAALSGSANLTFSWDAPTLDADLTSNAQAGQGSQLIDTFNNTSNQLLAATYEVIGSDQIGCSSAPTSVQLYIKPEPVLDTALTFGICSSQAAAISFTTVNQLPSSYSWLAKPLPPGLQGLNGAPTSSTGQVLNDAFQNSSRQIERVSYELQAEADGCQSISRQLNLDISPVIPTGSVILKACEGSSGSGTAVFNLLAANGQIVGDSLDAYFSDPELTQIVSNPAAFTAAGSIIYGARNGSMPCPETWRIQLQVQSLPVMPAAAQEVGCEGSLFSIQPPLASLFNFYDADPMNGSANLLASNSAQFDTLLPIPNSSVQIWITTVAGICESPASLTQINVRAKPIISQITSNSPLCEGDDLNLKASSPDGVSFNWTTGDPTFSVQDSLVFIAQVAALISDTYVVEVTNQDGCKAKDSVDVVVTPAPNPGQDTVINFCTGDPVFNLFDALGPNAARGGIWAGPSPVTTGFLGTFDPSQMNFGTYTYNLSQANCQRPLNARVNVLSFDFPQPQLTANSPLPEGDSLVLQAHDGIDFQWTGPLGFAATGSQVIRPDIQLEDSGLYRVTVTNAGGCTSHDSIFVIVNEIPRVSIQLAAFLEGPFDTLTELMWDSLRTGGYIPLQDPYGLGASITTPVLEVTGPNAIVDWVRVALRDPNDSLLIVDQKAFLIQRDGDIVDTDGISKPQFLHIPAGFYYVVLDHRNHLSVMSALPIELDKNGSIAVDFRDANTPVFGFNPIKVIGTQAFLFSGDANGDDQVQVVDLVNFWARNVGAAGYLPADWNMNGQVQNDDFFQIWIPNSGRGSQVPGFSL